MARDVSVGHLWEWRAGLGAAQPLTEVDVLNLAGRRLCQQRPEEENAVLGCVWQAENARPVRVCAKL